MIIYKLKEAIEIALKNKNYYAALALALAMPDICGKLEHPTKFSKERFKIWFDKYLKQYYETEIMGKKIIFLNSSDCYALRCAFLHEANDDISEQKAREILNKFKFTTLNSHNIKIHDVLALNVSRFCNDICRGIDEWLHDIAGDKEILERILKLITIEENGFSPFPGISIEG